MKKPPPKGGVVPVIQANGPLSIEQQPVRAVEISLRDQYKQPGELRIFGIKQILSRISDNRGADLQHPSSSSSRKRTHEDYLEGLTDADLEVLMNASVQGRRETRESMLPPPLPTQRAAQRPIPTRREQLESNSSQRYLESRSNIDSRPHANVPDIQTYQDRAWNDARHEDTQVSQPLRPYQPSGPPLMSGAIGPGPSQRGSQMDHQNVPQQRFTRPAPESRSGNEGHFRQSIPQSHSDLLQYQQNSNDPNRNIQTPAARLLPSRVASRSSFVRQPLISAPSRGNVRGPDSGYYSNGEHQHNSLYGHVDENYAPAPSRQADSMPQPSFDSPFFKPHFSGPVPQQESPMYQRGATRQSEQLVTGLRHLRMEPASQQPWPRTRPSLNALSFIDEPYTSTNQPIYARQRGAFSQSQEEQPYRPVVVSRAGLIQDPRVPQQPRRQSNSIRLPSAMPSSSQPLAHTSKGSRSGGSMVRPIGGQGVRPSTNSYSPGGGYFPRINGGTASSRGIFSAAGRRSVRR